MLTFAAVDVIKIHVSDKDPFIGFAESRIGGRNENQDSLSFADTPLGFLVTVCDGMGGGPGGKTASSIAVSEIIKSVRSADANNGKFPADIVKAAVEQASNAIMAESEKHPNLRGMGSTAPVLLLSKTAAIVAHVGDSRVYQFRDRQKVFRTFDHSVVFEMVRQHMLTEEQARLSPHSNIITRALGIDPDLKVEVNEIPYKAGDRFMLCTDGIHGCMPENELISLATDKHHSLDAVVDNIASTVDDLGQEHGGRHDNLTLAIIETKKKSKKGKKITNQIKFLLTKIPNVG